MLLSTAIKTPPDVCIRSSLLALSSVILAASAASVHPSLISVFELLLHFLPPQSIKRSHSSSQLSVTFHIVFFPARGAIEPSRGRFPFLGVPGFPSPRLPPFAFGHQNKIHCRIHYSAFLPVTCRILLVPISFPLFFLSFHHMLWSGLALANIARRTLCRCFPEQRRAAAWLVLLIVRNCSTMAGLKEHPLNCDAQLPLLSSPACKAWISSPQNICFLSTVARLLRQCPKTCLETRLPFSIFLHGASASLLHSHQRLLRYFFFFLSCKLCSFWNSFCIFWCSSKSSVLFLPILLQLFLPTYYLSRSTSSMSVSFSISRKCLCRCFFRSSNFFLQSVFSSTFFLQFSSRPRPLLVGSPCVSGPLLHLAAN